MTLASSFILGFLFQLAGADLVNKVVINDGPLDGAAVPMASLDVSNTDGRHTMRSRKTLMLLL